MRKRFNKVLGAWWALPKVMYKVLCLWYGSVVVVVVGSRSREQQGRTQTALEADIWVLPGRCAAMRSRSYIIDGYTRPVPGQAERAPEVGICSALTLDL